MHWSPGCASRCGALVSGLTAGGARPLAGLAKARGAGGAVWQRPAALPAGCLAGALLARRCGRRAAAARRARGGFERGPVPLPLRSLEEEVLGELCPEQAEVARAVLAGDSVFFTGEPGSGKSFLLQRLVRLLRQRDGQHDERAVAVCASTGVAAVHVGGSTLHSLMNWGHDGTTRRGRKGRQRAAGRLEAKCLLLDEVSMIPGDLFDKASKDLSRLRNDDQPFGGLQVVMCGDFLQLPPVEGDTWAFEAEEWNRLGPRTFCLRENHRQAGDAGFQELLRGVRRGETPEALRCASSPAPGRRERPGTRLVCTNAEANSENTERLAQLPDEAQDFRAQDTSDRSDGLSHQSIQAALRQLIAPETLSLKKDARVMLLKNLRLPSDCRTLKSGTRQMPLVNGSTGKVIKAGEDYVTVEFERFVGARRQRCQKTIRQAEFWGEIQGVGRYCRRQLPLRLAWALTVHKCQGMTLDGGNVDLSRLFEPAQMYVALSRFRSLSELRLDALPPASRMKLLVGGACGVMRERAARFHQELEQPRDDDAVGDASADDADDDADGDASADADGDASTG